MRRPDLLRDLIQVNLAEGVKIGTHQNNVLMTLNPIHSGERVIERIEQVGLRKARQAQLV
jgi:predicted metalloprotease